MENGIYLRKKGQKNKNRVCYTGILD